MLAVQTKPEIAWADNVMDDDIMVTAIRLSRTTLVQRLFKAVPGLATSNTIGHHLDEERHLNYLFNALAYCESPKLQEMLEVINAATGVLPAKGFTMAAHRVFNLAISKHITPTILKWLLSNGLIDLHSSKGRRFLHMSVILTYYKLDCSNGIKKLAEKAHVDEQDRVRMGNLVSAVQPIKPATELDKMPIFLEQDKSLAIYLPIANSKRTEAGYIAYTGFFDALNSALSAGELTSLMSPSMILMKLLAFGTHEGTLQRTARIIETLVALGASGSTILIWRKNMTGNFRRSEYSLEHVTALTYARNIKQDPGGGRRHDIPQATAADMSADHEISTYEEYLALRRASIKRIVKALLLSPIASKPDEISFSAMADPRTSVHDKDPKSRFSNAEAAGIAARAQDI